MDDLEIKYLLNILVQGWQTCGMQADFRTLSISCFSKHSKMLAREEINLANFGMQP